MCPTLIVAETNTECTFTNLKMSSVTASSRSQIYLLKPAKAHFNKCVFTKLTTSNINTESLCSVCGSDTKTGLVIHAHLSDTSDVSIIDTEFSNIDHPSIQYGIALALYPATTMKLFLEDVVISKCVATSSHYFYFEGYSIEEVLSTTLQDIPWRINMSTTSYTLYHSIMGKDLNDENGNVIDLIHLFFYRSNDIYVSVPSSSRSHIQQNDQQTCGRSDLPCATLLTAFSHLNAGTSNRIVHVLDRCFLYNQTDVSNLSISGNSDPSDKTQAEVFCDHLVNSASSDTAFLRTSGTVSLNHLLFSLTLQIVNYENLLIVLSGSLSLSTTSFLQTSERNRVRLISMKTGSIHVFSSDLTSLVESFAYSPSFSNFELSTSNLTISGTPKYQPIAFVGVTSTTRTATLTGCLFHFDLLRDGLISPRISFSNCSFSIHSSGFSEASPLRDDTVCTLSVPGMSLSQASGTITSCSFSNFKNGALLLDGDAQCVVSLSNITFWNNSPAFPSFPSLQRNIECRGNIALNLSEFSSTTEEQVNLSSDDHVGTDVRPNNSAGSWIRSLECQLETDDSVDPQTSFFGPTVDTISVIDQNPFIIVVLSGTNLFPCDLSYVVFSAERLQIEDPKRNTETALKIGMTIDPAVFNHSTIVSSFTQSYLASNALNETAGEITLSPTAFPNDTVDYFVSLTMKVCDPQCRTFSPLPDAGYLVKIRIRDPNAYQMPPGLMWSLIGIGITIVVVGVVVVVILVAIRSRKKELARRKRIEEQQQKQRELEREKERQRKNRVHRKGSRRRSSDISDQRNVTLLNKELSMIAEEEEMVWEEDDEDGAERTEGTPKQRSRSNSVASRRASLTGDKKQEKWDNMSNLPSIPDTNSGNPNSHSLFQSNSDLPSAEVSNPSDVQSEWEEEGESEWEAESEWEDEEEYEWEEGEEGEQEPFDWSFLQNLPPQAQAYLDVTEKVMKEMFPDFSFASFFEKHGA